tara:strand:+ start:1024 stop:1263 length:240 start_codon:yes stop_codon:yes gene_type:complete
MTFYLLLDGDSEKDAIYDTNVLGEESFGTFYTGNGFKALNNIVVRQPKLLEKITILDEKKNQYSVEEFLDLTQKWKIIT